MASEPEADLVKVAACWCCGTEHPAEELVRLGCHDEVGLCEWCIGWLADRRGGRQVRRAVPILATGDVERALAHYAALGFETEAWEGGGYGFVSRDGVELHLGDREGFDPSTNTVSCYLHVRDADAIFAEWAAAGVAGELAAPIDTDYGLREGSHVDPDGNVIRFGSPIIVPGNPDGRPPLISADDPVALAATSAVQAGDVDVLRRLLGEHPELAVSRIGSEGQSRTLLHVATDWPGHFLRVAETIALLAAAGADVDAHFVGSQAETPLHWAASSNDVEAIDALIAAGADIEATGAVLGGGSPLTDAVGFGQGNAARRLVEAGATTRLQDAAALGLMDRLEAQFGANPPPGREAITHALWAASNAGQRDAARYLLDRGADLNWIGWDDKTPLEVAVESGHQELADWLRDQDAKPSSELSS